MNKNQKEKLLAINEKTLIIGSDIAKHIHYARAQDYRGIEYGKPFKYENNRNGLTSLWFWIKNLMNEHTKNTVIFGIEPTGHYWYPMAWFLHEKGVKVVLVNPLHVKRSKELDDNSPTKNDIKDARVIAQLIKDGRYSEPNMLTGIYSDLRIGMNQYERLTVELTRVKLRIHNWLDRFFPEFPTVFKSLDGIASLEVLKNFPLPEDIVAMGISNIVKHWKDVKIKSVGIKRATKLVNQAKESLGLTEGLTMARLELNMIIEQYEMLCKQIESLIVLIESLVKQIPGTKQMLTIPSVGIVTIAGFLAEVGNLKSYDHWQQIVRLAGLNLKESSSGKHKGKTGITKRGRPRLRSVLFRAVLVLVKNNPEFKAIHQYLISRLENPLKRIQSIVALCGKLIRVLFTLGCKEVTYDAQMFLGTKRQSQLQLAA